MDTEDILEQTSVGGAAQQFNYTSLSNYRWLNKGSDYVVQLFIPSGTYYQANLLKTNKYLSIPRMVFCNNCNASTLPDPTSNATSFAGYNGGYADMQFYVRNDSIAMPSYVFGPFVALQNDTLKQGVYASAFADTLRATDGVAPYTYVISQGTLPNGINFSNTGIFSGTPGTAGSFTLEIKATDAGGRSANKTYSLVLNKANQSIQFTTIGDRFYGDTTVRLRATTSSGLPITYSITTGPITIQKDTVVVISATGASTVKATQAGNQFYHPATASQSFTIKPQPLVLTADNKTKQYGDNNPALTITYDGLVNGELSVPGATSTTTAVKSSGAGDYTITVSADPNSNYAITYKSGTLTVQQRAITVSLTANPDITKVYDGTDVATLQTTNYNLSNVVTGDNVSVSATNRYADNNAADNKTVTASSFVLGGTDRANYRLNTTSATTTGKITARPVTVSLQATPAITKTYDGNDVATIAAGNYSVSGILTGDDAILNKPTSGTYDTKQAGTGKQVTVSGLQLQGTKATNYALASTTASASIGSILQKAVTITADNKTKTYGDANPTLTVTYDGLVTGELTLPGVTASTGAVTTSGAGEYEIAVAANAHTNYAITYKPGKLTVQQRAITLTLNSSPAITKVYDGTDAATLQAANYHLGNLVTGDNLTISSTAQYANKSAGDNKTITASNLVLQGAAKNNYQLPLTSVTTTGSIKPRELIVVAANAAKVYGSADPVFTAQTTGLVGNDGLPAVLERAPGESVGSYAITLKSTGNADYTITNNTAANLTITPAPLKVTAED